MGDNRSDPAPAPANNNNTGLIFSRQSCPYNNVGVLALYWQKDDFRPSCREESQKIVSLFRHEFHYNVDEFAIPMDADTCGNELEFTISRFKREYNSVGNLMIVYYSGHGDRDRANNKAIWAAQSVGGPTVDWYLIQPQLMHAKADVLLVFDCCYASSAAKARGEGGIELLAASPSGGQTPRPGDSSFTHFFVQDTRQRLRDKGEVRVIELVASIFKQTLQDPVHLLLRETSRMSILLRPLSAPADAQKEQEFTLANSKGALTFTALIKSPPDDEAIQELGNWIKSSAPPNVMTVRVDRVVGQSSGFLDFLLKENKAGTKGRLLDHMRHEDKKAVLATLQSIADLTSAPHASSSQEVPTPGPAESEAILSGWERRLQKLSSRVWAILKAHPAFQKAATLEQLEQNESAAEAGITAAAKLQLLSRDLRSLAQDDIQFWPRREVKYTKLLKRTDRYVTCRIDSKPRIVEIIHTSAKAKTLSLPERKAAIAKVLSLLSSQLPEQFRVCRCVGFTAETDGGQGGWYGLVFDFPDGTDTFAPLLSTFNRLRRMSLERRYRMAYDIAQTIMALQSIGWVHKGVRSETILFLSSKPSLASHEPYSSNLCLFGFEHAREESDDTKKESEFRRERMIYTPPSRWGNPQEKFSYPHDVYALGVLLLELGYWKSIFDIKSELRNVPSAEEAQDVLISLSRGEDLAHIMGSAYAHIVEICLTGQNCRDETLPQFQRQVLDTLERLAANIATCDV